MDLAGDHPHGPGPCAGQYGPQEIGGQVLDEKDAHATVAIQSATLPNPYGLGANGELSRTQLCGNLSNSLPLPGFSREGWQGIWQKIEGQPRRYSPTGLFPWKEIREPPHATRRQPSAEAAYGRGSPEDPVGIERREKSCPRVPPEISSHQRS